LPFVSSIATSSFLLKAASATELARSRVRPGDPGWPAQAMWDELNRNVGGRLIKVASPLQSCTESASGTTCDEIFSKLRNPYYLGDEAGLTQSLGWADAWISSPSIYAVEAETTGDVVAAVNFARV